MARGCKGPLVMRPKGCISGVPRMLSACPRAGYLLWRAGPRSVGFARVAMWKSSALAAARSLSLRIRGELSAYGRGAGEHERRLTAAWQQAARLRGYVLSEPGPNNASIEFRRGHRVAARVRKCFGAGSFTESYSCASGWDVVTLAQDGEGSGRSRCFRGYTTLPRYAWTTLLESAHRSTT